MKWLADNWIWVIVIGIFLAMHLSGRGCCGGGHGGRKRPPNEGGSEETPTDS
ncbi:MAG: hypothetical protein AB7D06_16220 [Pedobacter sp.]